MNITFLVSYARTRIGFTFILNALWYLFLLFLGICACVVLIKLAFGTLHIHITIDNPEIFTKTVNKKENFRELRSILKEEPRRNDRSGEEETPQGRELRRFKEMLKSDGMLSDGEIEAITYEDLQRYKKGE